MQWPKPGSKYVLKPLPLNASSLQAHQVPMRCLQARGRQVQVPMQARGRQVQVPTRCLQARDRQVQVPTRCLQAQARHIQVPMRCLQARGRQVQVPMCCRQACQVQVRRRCSQDHCQTVQGCKALPCRCQPSLWTLQCLHLLVGLRRCPGQQRVLFVLEHPEDPLYAMDYEGPSLWVFPELLALKERFGMHFVAFDQGAVGHASPKPTRLLTNSWSLYRSLQGKRVEKKDRVSLLDLRRGRSALSSRALGQHGPPA